MVSSFCRFIFIWIIIFLCFCFETREVLSDHWTGAEVNEASHSALISESVLYLQKAISQVEMGHDLQDATVRVAPIVTVTTGLLEAGFSPEEPLLQSSLRFLQQFYEDQKSSVDSATISENLFTQIKVCLDKARQNPFTYASHDRSLCSDELDDPAWLLKTLDSFDDLDAVSRAKEFVGKLNVEPTVDTAIAIMDEMQYTQYVVSQGWGQSVRIHDLCRTLAEQATLLNVEDFSSLQFDSLIAAVYGQQAPPLWPDKPRQPKQKSHLATRAPSLRPNDYRKKSTDEQVTAGFSERYQTMLNAFEPHQSVLRRHLLADALAVLQTVCRLE